MTTKYKYSLTQHAIDRANARFGVGASEVIEWVNDKMRGAKYVSSASNGTLTYVKEGVQIVVNPQVNRVITLYNEISLAFLQPVLEREIRKLERQHTKEVRRVELDKAMLLKEYGKMAVNHANARNPKTRELIKGRMDETMTKVGSKDNEIERISAQFAGKIKAIEMMAE